MQAHVYVIGSEESPLTKIGVTDDTSRRLREIQSMSPVPLQVLWKTPGGRPLERALHRYFHWARQHGEWFRLDNPVEAVKEALQDPQLHTLQLERPKKPNWWDVIDLGDPGWWEGRPVRRKKPVEATGGGWTQPTRISGKAVGVYEGLLARIDSGEFPVGSVLPPIGVLAAAYEVPTVTVMAAVKHLMVQGRVVWPRHGQASVSPRAEPGPSKAG